MKTSTVISNLGLICVSSSKGMGGTGPYFAPGQFSGDLAAAALAGHLSLEASHENLKALGGELLAIARHARFLRQTELVEWASQAMLALPIHDLQSIGRYYQAYCQQRRGEVELSRLTLTRVADEAPPGYRERAILELGGSYIDARDFQASAPYCVEAARAARNVDLLTNTQAIWNLAILRSVDGDHHGALRDLERLRKIIKVIRRSYPVFYYDYLNSLAVELSAVGRNEEAKRIINKLLGLAIAGRYPTWRQTADEIVVNEARGVSCPLVFAIWSPSDAVSTGEALPAPDTAEARVGKNLDVDAGLAATRTSAAVATDSAAETAPARRQRARVFRLCSIRWGVIPAVTAANARVLTKLQSAVQAISWGCLAVRPRDSSRIKRVGSRRATAVPVPSEYPSSPLARGPPGTPIKP